MAVPPPPPSNPGLPKESLTVSGRTNRYTGTTYFGGDALVPPEINISNTISYNGFVWTLSEGVTNGRFISGEPFIVIPAAGVTVMSVTPGPTVVTGYMTEADQLGNTGGITMWINGSMKNPRPWWEQREFNWDQANLGATVYNWNYDERAAANTNNKTEVLTKLPSPKNSMADWLYFPIKLIPGDVLVSAKSSFNGDWRFAVKPQGSNKYVRWTNPDMSRMCIEKYGILSALSSVPTYKDCYRPPVFWHGPSLAERPIFYRHDAVKNTENYIVNLNGKNIKGFDINPSDPQILSEIENWKKFVTEYWTSTHIPYYSGTHHQTAVSAYDLYNSNPDTPKAGYLGKGAKVKDKMMQSVFASWIPRAQRKIALDKVTQFSIDCWGLVKGGGIPSGDGGYHAAAHRPWVVFLGWLYGRNDIVNFHQDPQFLAKLAPGLTGPWVASNIQVPTAYYYKSLTSQDYRQRAKIYGSDVGDLQGFTAWRGTNPNNDLYHGLTSPSTNASAANLGWIYKLSGISAAYGYTVTSIESKGKLAFGSFAVVVADRDFVCRLSGLGPGSGKPEPATLPPNVNSNGNLLNRCFASTNDVEGYWGFKQESMYGLNLEIVSGPGSGPTVYKIVDVYNTFVQRNDIKEDDEPEEGEVEPPPGAMPKLRYASFILDRDFQNGLVTKDSVFKIYPVKANETIYSFDAGAWMRDINSAGKTLNGGTILPIYAQKSYNNIADEAMIKHYALQNHLGITQDQFLVDYVKETYFNENLPNITRRTKCAGYYVGEIFDSGNILGGKVIVEMLGLTGNQFLPADISGLSGADDLEPELSLDGIGLTFTPQPIIGYKVLYGSGETYNGYGVTFTTPITPLKITAIIDDKIFIDKSQPALYNLMKELKIQMGPFMTNTCRVEDREDENDFEDHVVYYDFGRNRSSIDLSITDIYTDYVKAPPNFIQYAQQNKQISFNLATQRLAMAGCAGVLPNIGESVKLASTFGVCYLNRLDPINPNQLVLKFVNSEIVNPENMWYCISGVTIGAGNTAMAEEYKYENWNKIENYVYNNGELTFSIPNLHSGLLTPNYNPNTTDDKLIFFRYLVDKYVNVFEASDSNVPAPIGITALPFNSTNYSGWNNTPIVNQHMITSVKSNNTNGNEGYFNYIFSNTNSSTDYRRLDYNHFRLIHNNYFEFENIAGLPAFTTFYEDDGGDLYPRMFMHGGFKYNGFFTDTSVTPNRKYYSPKGNNIICSIIGADVSTGEQFYNKYIHGQTMIFHLPSVPHTLLWCTGATT